MRTSCRTVLCIQCKLCAFRKLAEKEHSDQLFLIRILNGAVDTTKSVSEVFKIINALNFFTFLVAAKTSFLVVNTFRIPSKVGNSYIWWWHDC